MGTAYTYLPIVFDDVACKGVTRIVVCCCCCCCCCYYIVILDNNIYKREDISFWLIGFLGAPKDDLFFSFFSTPPPLLRWKRHTASETCSGREKYNIMYRRRVPARERERDEVFDSRAHITIEHSLISNYPDV